jgi:type I restriction enzyme S subunit
MKTYPKMKNSSVPWLGMIPGHWDIRRIKHFYRRKVEKNLPDGEVLSLYRDFGIVIKSSREDNFNKTSDDTSNYNVVDVYDLVVNKMKAWQGSVAVSEHRGIVSPAYYVCSPLTDTIYWRYIHLLLRAAVYHPEYRRLSEGIRLGQWDLSYDDWKNIRIPVPHIDEQRAIAEYLDKTTAKIDGLIAAQENLIELLAEKRKALISHVVTKGLNTKAKLKDSGVSWIGKIPEQWDSKRLRFLFSMYTGISITKDELKEEGIPCIGYGAIHSKYTFDVDLRRDALPCAVIDFENSKPFALLNENDFVFCDTSEDIEGSGNCVHVFHLDGSKLLAGSHTVRLSPIEKMHARYIAYLFKATGWKAQVQCQVTGTKVYSISQSILKDTFAVLPPLDEQRAIAEYLDKATAKLDTLAAKAEEAIALMKERRSALISAVVTGKVKVS